MKGEFFAIGFPQLKAACQLGMNPAIALLVMARGTLRDNSTTNWSAFAVYNHSGISRRRAQAAIALLAEHDLIDVLRIEPRPKYKLQKPNDNNEMIWLPNSLVDGAGDEIPPLTKLREFGDVRVLEKFILLYHEQDLEADGGIPRTVARTTFTRTRIDDIGPFTLYGFVELSSTSTECGLFSELEGYEDDEGNQGAWAVLNPLLELGLLQETYYMAESSDDESELIYPINDDTKAAIMELWSWIYDQELFGCIDQEGSFDCFGIAPKHVRNACLVGCYRLHYRPRTTKTSRWWAKDCERTEAMVGLIQNTCFKKVPELRAHQG